MERGREGRDHSRRTVCMREKEKMDYRFMHEPNIPTLRVSRSEVMGENLLNSDQR